jgi:uncharacterized protein YecE (DUF72 family)
MGIFSEVGMYFPNPPCLAGRDSLIINSRKISMAASEGGVLRTGTHIGTSGWHYKHWRGPFYPEDLSPPKFLKFYAERFRTVEINNTFYRLPRTKALMTWRQTVPRDFIFSVKASRFITHVKKLNDPESSVAKFFETVEILGETLGPVLFQLPPGWKCNPDRLQRFLEVIPRHPSHAFEFREPGWFDDRVYKILEEHDAAFCIYELAGRLSPRVVTSRLVYIRLHGPDGPYQGSYSDEALGEWARVISGWRKEGRDVYCYFDNDQAGYAAQDARRLEEVCNRILPGTKLRRETILHNRAG